MLKREETVRAFFYQLARSPVYRAFYEEISACLAIIVLARFAI